MNLNTKYINWLKVVILDVKIQETLLSRLLGHLMGSILSDVEQGMWLLWYTVYDAHVGWW